MRHIPDRERRSRLAVRHAIAPSARAADPVSATRVMTALHSTEPATVYLSLVSRVAELSLEDVDRALYVDRLLVKQLAMRRTLFVFPRDLLPAAWGSASARVADVERRRMVKDVERAGVAANGDAWLDAGRAAVLGELEQQPDGLTAIELRQAIPEIAVKVDVTAGSVWGAARVLTHLGATADILRGTNTVHWRLSRPRWTRADAWLGERPEPWPPEVGYAELVARWLWTFGPGTEADLVWWLGATKMAVRAALRAVDAVEVGLDGGGNGWVLPDDPALDTDGFDDVEPWAALLPVLDPTVMGWKQRDFYLGKHAPHLFDRNGNAGTTAWWDGRVVGCWVQDEAGVVEVRLLEQLPPGAVRALAAEAERLTAWLGGVSVGTVYPSAAMKAPRPWPAP